MKFPSLTLADANEMAAENKLIGTFDMEDQDYREAPGLNQSSMKWLLKCPAAYKYSMNVESKSTKALEMGSLIHTLVLEGQDKFEDRIIATEVDRRTKAYKELKAENPTKIIITRQEFDMMMGIHASALSDSLIKSCLSNGQPEISAFATHPDHNVLLRGKVDWITDNTLFDLKSTVSASEKDFRSSCWSYRYDIQAAYYLDLVSWATDKVYDNFIFLVVEKTPPYLFNYFVLAKEDLDIAREEINEIIRSYKECSATGVWPGFTKQIKTLKLRKFK